MKNAQFLLLLLLCACMIFFARKIYRIENEKRLLKEDIIELSKIKYGLFRLDEWKQILARIITKKIQELFTTLERTASGLIAGIGLRK